MEVATDVVPAPPFVVAAEAAATTDLGDCDNAKRQKRMNYQPWEVAALVFTCHAATVAKPQSTIQYRSGYVREHYSKFAEQCLKMYGLKEGEGGTHTIALSHEIRTALSLSGKNKGKSPGMGKYQDMISECANNILPIYKRQLDSAGKIPSGKQVADVIAATKSLYYDSRFALQSGTGKMTKQMPPAWTDNAWGCFVLFGPHGKGFAEFCLPSDTDAQPSSRAAALALASMSSKAACKNEGACSISSMDRAFADHNNIMVAKMMMKYGSAEDKAKALATLREFWDRGKENKEEPETPEDVIPIPFNVAATPIAHQIGPDTGDAVGDDGLTWAQRVCKRVYESTQCRESEHGFTPEDVVEKMNGRIDISVAKDATDFLMIEMHICTTSEDNHYKPV